MPDRYVSAEVDGARERVVGSLLRVGAASRVRIFVGASGEGDWEPLQQARAEKGPGDAPNPWPPDSNSHPTRIDIVSFPIGTGA